MKQQPDPKHLANQIEALLAQVNNGVMTVTAETRLRLEGALIGLRALEGPEALANVARFLTREIN